MGTVGFLVMFFGLLAAGMPIFLVLGTCAAILFFVSGQTDGRRGAEHDRPAQFHDTDGAAAVCHGGRIHATRRRGAGAGRSVGRMAWGHQRLAGAGRRGVLRAVRGDLGFVGRDSAGDGHHPAAGDAGARLSAWLRARRAGRVGHHWRGDPAITGADPVWHRHRAVGAAAVPRRDPAWLAAGRRIFPVGAVLRAPQEFSRRAAIAVHASACA